MSSVFDMLETEWHRLANDSRWTDDLADVCAVVGAAGLAELLRWVRRSRPEESDRVLVPLAARASAGDERAARVLLQLLLPGTRRLAETWWSLGDDEERAAAAVAAVYERIRRYPFHRRPGKVAANVLWDAHKDLHRAVRRITRAAQYVVCAEPQALYLRQPVPDEDEELHPAEELAQALVDAVAAGHLRAADAHLIAATRIGGRRLADMAAERGERLRTLQWRRQRGEAALAGTGTGTAA